VSVGLLSVTLKPGMIEYRKQVSHHLSQKAN
jgi:hypothetical protein